METDLKGIVGVVLIVGLVFLCLATLAFINYNFKEAIPITTNTTTLNYVIDVNTPQTLVEEPVSSATLTTPNQTWLNFNGYDDNLTNITYNSAYNLNGQNFSVILTYNWTNKSGTNQNLVALGHGESNYGGWRISFSENGWIYLRAQNFSGSSYNCRFGDFNHNDNLWHDLGFTFDALNGLKMYWDGNITTTGTCSFIGYMNNTLLPITLGNSFDKSQNFNGSISRLKIYNTSLSQIELQSDLDIKRNGVIIRAGSSYMVMFNSSGYAIGMGSNKTYESYNNLVTFSNVFNFSINSSSPYGIAIDSNNSFYVSFMNDRRLYKTVNKNGNSWKNVLNFTCENGTMWSSHGFTEDNNNNLYVGEYSTGGQYNCAYIYKSSNFGDTWSIVYNSTLYNNTGKHIHFVASDPYTNIVYASIGDGLGVGGNKSIIRSLDQGLTWQTIMNEATEGEFDSHPTAIAFTPTKRLFFTDTSSSNGVFETTDDINFNSNFLLPSNLDLPIYWAVKDLNEYIYFGTAEVDSSHNGSIYYTKDYGLNWIKLYEANVSMTTPSNVNLHNQFNFNNGYNGMLINGFKYNPKTSNLIGYWNLNENNGSILYDISPIKNNGTKGIGATWQTDGQTRTINSGYLITGTNFTLTDSSLAYSFLNLSYVYESEDVVARDVLDAANLEIVNNTSLAGLILTVSLIAIVISIILGIFVLRNKGV